MKSRTLVLSALLCSSVAMAAPMGPQESLVELVPAKATLAAVVRKHAIVPLRDMMFSDPEMMRELKPYLERTIGIDLTRIDGITIFALGLDTADPRAAIILHIPSASSVPSRDTASPYGRNEGQAPLKLPVAGDAGGTPLYKLDKDQVCARLKSGLVVGSEVEVRAAVAVDRGREPALARDSPLGRQLGGDVNDVDIAVALGVGALPPDKTMGMKDATLTLRHSGLLELVVHGDPANLGMAHSMLSLAMQSYLQSLQQSKDKEVAGGDAEMGATAIYTYYQAKRAVTELEPKLDGDALRSRYKLPDLQSLGSPVMLAALVSAGALYAIPSLTKYGQPNKLAAVRADVQHIASSVATWGAQNKKLAALKSTDWSPSGNCCGQPGNQCAASASAFAAPTWQAIGVTIDAASAFHYRVLVDAKKKQVTVEAQGDPDCDNALTTVRSIVSFSSGSPVVGDVIVTGDRE